jgi:F-type H+-transporting ATPase subunit b
MMAVRGLLTQGFPMFEKLSILPFALVAVIALSAIASANGQQPPAEVASEAEVQAVAAPPAAPHEAGDHTRAAADHGEHEHIGAAGANTQAEEFKEDLAIWTFVVFLLLLGILWRFAWGPILAGLEKREHRIAEHIAAAEKAHEDARLMLAQYEKKLASSADEVRAIIDEARRDAEHTQQEILAKARADAQTERDRAIREIETAKDQALKELGERTANLAVDLAGKIVGARLNASDHQRLINEALTRFPKSSPSTN